MERPEANDALNGAGRVLAACKEDPRRTKVFVTGGGGFIGRACVDVLRACGAQVVAPSSRELDLFDSAAVRAFLAREQPTHLLHTAWRRVHGDVMVSAANARWVEVSLALLRAFQEAGGQRAAYIGSCAEYDWTWGTCKTGVTPLRPATTYGMAKLALYLAASGYARATGLRFVWPRLFFVYGPGEHESRLSVYVVRSLLQGLPAELSHGHQIRDYLYVTDAAEGIVAALYSRVEGEIDIASGLARPLREIATTVAAALGREDLLRLGAKPVPPHETPVVVSDVTHARALLGWAPRYRLQHGVSELAAWGRRTFTKAVAALALVETALISRGAGTEWLMPVAF